MWITAWLCSGLHIEGKLDVRLRGADNALLMFDHQVHELPPGHIPRTQGHQLTIAWDRDPAGSAPFKFPMGIAVQRNLLKFGGAIPLLREYLSKLGGNFAVHTAGEFDENRHDWLHVGPQVGRRTTETHSP